MSAVLRSLNSKDTDIESYGAVNFMKKVNTNFRRITSCDLLICFFIFWNCYSSRKLLFPFSIEFSSFYNISIDQFSYALAAFDLGGIGSVILTVCSFHNVRMHFMLFLLTIAVSILYISLSFSNTFIALFALRMVIGFFCTVIQAQIRGALSAFLKDDDESNELGKGIICCECGWWSSTISWVFVGIILNRLTVDYVWYYASFCALLAAISCFLLPKSTISQIVATRSQSQIGYTDIEAPGSLDYTPIWKRYYIYFCLLTLFLVGMGYNAYLASFGAWMTQEFNLNPERLGASTLVITASECTGFVTIFLMQRYKFQNIKICMVQNFGGCLAIFAWFMVLKAGVYSQTTIWIIVFIYTVFFEHVYLSLIVTNLELAPQGMETKLALWFGVVNRASTVVGIIVGPHLTETYGFTYLMRWILVIQCCAFICICITYWQWKSINSKHNQCVTVKYRNRKLLAPGSPR